MDRLPGRMGRHHRWLQIAAALTTLVLLLSPMPLHAQKQPRPQVIGYVFPNLPDGRPIVPADIHAAELTRINYAFAFIKDGKVVESSPQDAGNLAVLRSLKAKNPDLEVLVSVGGWLGSDTFSDAVLTAASRRRLVDSAVAFLARYKLDGLDLDWEYPGMAGATNHFRPEDGANFLLLLQELRSRFDAQTRPGRKPLLLSIAAGSTAEYIAHSPLAEEQRFLDTVNLMAYDYAQAGATPRPTGNNAPLFADPQDPAHASAAGTVQAFLAAGVPASKLVLGVPFYGHLWTEVPPANHGLFQPGVAASPPMPTGNLDIRNMLEHGFTRFWDSAAAVPYAYNPGTRQFVSYEDPESLGQKCAYVQKQGLGGIMFWQYFSDPSGTLLNTVHSCLYGPAASPAAGQARP